jgi:hypothetical protein
MMNSWRDRMLAAELGKEAAERLIREQDELLRLYSVYDGDGQKWDTREGLDYKPTKRVTNNIKFLIKEVARFMFSHAPEITVQPAEEGEENAGKCAALEQYVRQVLQDSGWQGKLTKAGRDQLIGKRVALKVTGGPNRPLRVAFRPALEIWADYDPEDIDRLTKLIYLYQAAEGNAPEQQRFWVQRYAVENGKATVWERVVDGRGELVEERMPETALPIPYIPSYVLINDGLTGDTMGESEVTQLEQLAGAYNRMTSDDQDAMRFNMYPQTAFIDASQDSLANIKVAPKAIIDLQTDPAKGDTQARAQVLESSFGYDSRLENALDRLDVDMRKMLGVPPRSLDEYKSSGLSGKAMKALYWPLITKCDEKWTEWDTALTWMVNCLYDLAVANGHADGFAGAKYTVGIEHLYPITEDEEEERALDLREVAQGARSIRSYIDKWRPSADADEEVRQIVLERRMLEEQYGGI